MGNALKRSEVEEEKMEGKKNSNNMILQYFQEKNQVHQTACRKPFWSFFFLLP